MEIGKRRKANFLPWLKPWVSVCRKFDEYLGSFWHGNPEIYNLSDINPKTGLSFGELYFNTVKRIQNLEEDGYDVVYKWGK